MNEAPLTIFHCRIGLVTDFTNRAILKMRKLNQSRLVDLLKLMFLAAISLSDGFAGNFKRVFFCSVQYVSPIYQLSYLKGLETEVEMRDMD